MRSSPDRRQFFHAKAGCAVLLAGWALLLVDCTTLHQTLLPRQSWSREWGHMVPHESFPDDCGLCHIPDRWDIVRDDFEFDHFEETGYRLEGAHREAACLRCHNDRGPVQVYTARGCGGCHPDPHKSSLSLECTSCHNQDSWFPIGLIAEHAKTRFPLIGPHAVASCESCHRGATLGDFRDTPVDCHLCHQRDAANAFPNHVINNWITACERCHNTTVFAAAPGFNHDQFFVLDGAHTALDCLACHPNGRFLPIPADCFDCHQNDYLAAPNHVAGGFSTDCTLCHNTTAWK